MDKAALVMQNLPFILTGVKVTLQLTGLALSSGLVIGLGLALARTYGHRLAAGIATGYQRLVRGVPTLVLMLFFYLVIADVLNIPTFSAAALALGLHSSAYQAEIFRSAIHSIGPGQMQAARSLGMTQPQAIGAVILPQALRAAIPAWSNEAAVVLKDTSLAYAIGVTDLLRRAEYVSARTFEPLLFYCICGLIYLILTFGINRCLDYLEERYRLPTAQ